jgi:hypothetical protein
MRRHRSAVFGGNFVFATVLVLGCNATEQAEPATTSVVDAISAAALPAPKRIFGQKDLKQTNYNEVAANRTFHPAGVFVDRASSAASNSRVYIWDSSNNRILGYDTIGTCSGGSKAGQACTEDSFCTGGSCPINPTKNATFALGQPTTAGTGACNGDNTTRAAASSGSLCLVPFPNQISPLEGPRGGQMARDSSRNLYVVDTFNNRVLKYNDPFANDKLADVVWGQTNMTNRLCNRGLSAPTKATLCTGAIDEKGYWFFFTSALDVSPDGQQIWVADPGNKRVLKFKPGSQDAQLVLGQTDFTSVVDGCANPDGPEMCAPTGVAYDAAANILYVMDGRVEGPANSTGRILVYTNPGSGQAPAIWTAPAGATFKWPRGLTLEPGTGALWVNDTDNFRALRFVGGNVTHILGDNDFSPDSGCFFSNPVFTPAYLTCNPHGTMGIDRDGKFYLPNLTTQVVAKFPSAATVGGSIVEPVGALFDQPGRNNHVYANRVGPSGLANPGYVVFVGTQMVVTDRYRIVFWNNYNGSTTSGANANGVLAQADLNSQEQFTVNQGSQFTSLAYDATKKLLYATHGPWISIWNVPTGVVDKAAPSAQIPFWELLTASGTALPCTNGCNFVNLHVDAATDTGWVVESNNHRVLRITNLSTANRRVDFVLGQANLTAGTCNRGAGIGNTAPNGFCDPAQVVLDAQKNVFVVDGTWECRDGNCRIVAYPKAAIPAPNGTVQAISTGPMQVYGPSDFASRSCDPQSGRLCSPRFLAFDPRDGAMVAAADTYAMPQGKRLAVWTNPLKGGVVSPPPTAFYSLSMNQAGNIAFDPSGNMAVLDHTWNRVVFFSPTPACNPATGDCAGECTTNAHCNDGMFCNGVETCVAGQCKAGTSLGAACFNATPITRFQNSGNFNTFAERWFVISEEPQGWQAGNLLDRTVRVNGTIMSHGQMPLPAAVEGGRRYFHFGPGMQQGSQFTNWSFW